MDMSFANQGLCIEYLAGLKEAPARDVHPVPVDIDRRIAELKLNSLGVRIDELTDEQKRYLESWEGKAPKRLGAHPPIPQRRDRVAFTFTDSPSYLYTSESVTEGHPDKLCDQISDAILDAIIARDPGARVACETCVTNGLVAVMGEITTDTYV